jgi:hypothetical protein
MNPQHFAVVVGINRYPGMSDLRAAHADADDFYRWVTDPNGGGVPPENASLVLAEFPEGATPEQVRPTREAIHAALEAFIPLGRAIPPSDWDKTRLYFYGAGHGIAPEARDAALLAANATRDRYGRHVSCVSLLDYFSNVQIFRELVLFADCCRTSVIGTVHRMPVEWTVVPIDNGAVRKFLACGAIFRQLAFEERDRPPDEQRGYFTRALMDGLRGASAAVDSEKGHITSTRLKNHITEHMRRATEGKFLSPLEPDFVDEGAGEIFFGPQVSGLRKLITHAVRLEVQSVAVTGLEVAAFGSAIPALRLVPTIGGGTVFECHLPVGVYEAIPIGASPRPCGEEWLFKVVEGGVDHAF